MDLGKKPLRKDFKTSKDYVKAFEKHSAPIDKEISKHIAKSRALKNKKEGFDSHKRMGNSAMKGHGVNSHAMMEARRKFNK